MSHAHRASRRVCSTEIFFIMLDTFETLERGFHVKGN